MKHLKTYTKLFESLSEDLSDILLEINDETYWQAECWNRYPVTQNGRWVVIIQTVDDEGEYVRSHKPLPIVIETIERAIEFMMSEGFTNHVITSHFDDGDEYDEITLGEVQYLDVWPNNFIRIVFWK